MDIADIAPAATRHAVISKVLDWRQRGLVTDLEMIKILNEVIAEHPCGCIACSK